MKNNPKTTKKAGFGKALLIYGAALTILFAVALVVFWQFLASYDASLPETTMRAYLEDMTRDDWKELLCANEIYHTNDFESSDALYGKNADAIAGSELSFVKNYEKYTDDAPAYDLVCEGKKFATVTLQVGGGVGFGFYAYDVASCEMMKESIAIEPFSVMVLAPKAAEVKLNGISLDGGYITEADMESRQVSKYCMTKETRPTCSVYTVEGFYGVPTVEALLNGTPLTAEENGALFVFDYPEETFTSLTVKAPSNATVRINGIKLTDEPSSKEVLGKNPYEEKLDDRISMNTYVLHGLFEEPEVSCIIGGKSAPETKGDGIVTFDYPEELIYRATVMAPAGATVSVNGIELTPETERTTGVYDGFDQRTIALWMGGNYPMCDTYDLGEMYFEPEIKASLDGVALNVTAGETPNAYAAAVGYPTDTEVPEEIALAAEDFVHTFVYYMTRGYYEFDRNILLAQSKVLKGSDAFRNVRESGYGVYFNSCYDILSNEATAVSVTRYTDHCVKVAVDYQVDKVRHSRNYHDEGRYEVTLVDIEGIWHVVEFESVLTH